MKHFDILVIGGDAAGMSAASQARRINNDISIGVFEKTGNVSYAACGMPYFIDGVVHNPEELLAIDKNKFIKERNIQIFTGTEIKKIDFNKKQAEASHNGSPETYSYGRLVIATGARAVKPPIKGINSKNVFVLRNLDEGIAIRNYIKSANPSKGIIVGGGSIGLEMAESLRALGIETLMLEKMDTIASAFDTEIRDIVTKELIKNNVTVKTGINIKEIQENTGSLLYDDERAEADFIIVSTGITPNTEFIKDSGIILDKHGAVIVNEKSETNIPDVYAAGDCATARHLISGEDVYMPLGTTANKQGRVAGLQAAGIKNERFSGITGTQLVKVFNLELAKTGFSEAEAARHGIKTESSGITWRSRAGYYPGAKSIFAKITINSSTREIIGGQLAGEDGAALRANVLAAAITAKMKIEDFAYMDLGYAPPFSPVWDVLLSAAQNLLIRK